MIAIILLVLAGLVCVAFALIMLYFAIKHKDNEIVPAFVIGLAICVGGAVWCANDHAEVLVKFILIRNI